MISCNNRPLFVAASSVDSPLPRTSALEEQVSLINSLRPLLPWLAVLVTLSLAWLVVLMRRSARLAILWFEIDALRQSLARMHSSWRTECSPQSESSSNQR